MLQRNVPPPACRDRAFPLAHSLRVAGCQDIVAYGVVAAIFADCPPAAGLDLATRDAVFEVDLGTF